MSKFQTIVRLIKHDRSEIWASIVMTFFKWLPDAIYLKLVYFCKMGHRLDLRNPKTFTEKIQWLKLYDRQPKYTTMVDKYAVKDYVAGIIGSEHIIPTIGVWSKPEYIHWDALPSQFVLKTSHGGGGVGVVICKDKQNFDRSEAVKRLNKSLASNIYSYLREWPYKNINKCIIAEPLMKSKGDFSHADLPDYKFFCFSGEPLYCQVIRNRNSQETIDFYDMNWQHMEFVGLNPNVQNGITPVSRPSALEKMKEICRQLSKDIRFLRVDLYLVDDKVYFGELTFYPASGIGCFCPKEWDNRIGDLIVL